MTALDESERQATLLALAQLAMRRPGWQSFLEGIAAKLEGSAMFTEFQRTSASEQPAMRTPAPSQRSTACGDPACIACQDGDLRRCLHGVRR